MQILVLIAYTAVLLAAGTNAASFVNLDQLKLQYDAVEIDDAELSTQVTGNQLPLPFPCTPNYRRMHEWPPNKELLVYPPGSICFAANGNFAVPSEVGKDGFFIFDKSGNYLMKGNYPDDAYIITGCAFSSTALYFADRGEKKIYKYTTDGEYVGTFVTGYEFGRLAAADGKLYAIVDRNEAATVRAYEESSGNSECNIKTYKSTQAKALAFDTKGNLNVGLLGNKIEVYTLYCQFVSIRVYPEVGAIDGLAFDGSDNNVILDARDRKVKVISPSDQLIKELGPFSQTVPVDVGIGIDCNVYVPDITTRVVYVYKNYIY